MPCLLRIALIAFLAIPMTATADELKPSPQVKRILDKAAVEVKKNRQEFDKANEKPLGEARKALEELSTKLIKDGKAEEATAVLKQVGTLETDVLRMANSPAIVALGGGARVAPNAQLIAYLCKQKWKHGGFSFRYSFNADGSYVLEGSSRSGKYEIMGDEKKQIKLMWNGETRVEFVEVGDRPDNWRMNGQPFVPAEPKP